MKIRTFDMDTLKNMGYVPTTYSYIWDKPGGNGIFFDYCMGKELVVKLKLDPTRYGLSCGAKVWYATEPKGGCYDLFCEVIEE